LARPVAYLGSCRVVVFATCKDGSCPARTFFDDAPEKVRRRFAVLFKRIGDTGQISNREQFKSIGPNLFEFKCHRYRLFCVFLKDREVLLTHGCEKKKDRLDSTELDRARRIHEEDLVMVQQYKGRKTH